MFGMGHREFAKFTGFDESTILHWENGYSRPSIHSVDKLSSICGIDIAYKPDEIYNPYERKSGSFPDKPPNKIGSHIHAARARKKLSCRQAAKHFQIEHNNFIAWEKNEVTPMPRYFPKIINFIGYCPIPKINRQTKCYLNRVYRNGRSMSQQAKLEGICERTVSKRELDQRTVR
jgi:DNA-binding transcriptional regulator YiaG